MKISTKFRYGLRAMLDLAIAQGDSPVLVQSIAERQQLSKKYLENLLIALKSAGLVRSVRGAKGGYLLARNPEEITVEAISTALEGPLVLADCVSHPGHCDRLEECATQELWASMTNALVDIMRNTTLADIVARSQEMAAKQSSMYYI